MFIPIIILKTSRCADTPVLQGGERLLIQFVVVSSRVINFIKNSLIADIADIPPWSTKHQCISEQESL